MARKENKKTTQGVMTAEIVPLKRRRSAVWERISSNLVLHLPTGMYYVRKRKKGKEPLFRSTGQKVKARAQTMADLMQAKWLGSVSERVSDRVISEIIDELKEVLESEFRNGDRRLRTWHHDQTYLSVIKTHFGDSLVSRVDESYWDEWVRTQGRKLNRTLFDVAKYLSKVLTYAYSKRYIDRKPRIRNPDPEKKSGVIYEDAHIQAFLEHADPLLRDMIILQAENPFRPHEVKALQWDWIEINRRSNETVAIAKIPASFTKTARYREFVLSQNSLDVLNRRLKRKSKSPYVFPSPKREMLPMSDGTLSRLWRRMLSRGGFKPGLKFHWLRHSFFSRALLDARLPIQIVSEAGGTSVAMLQRKYLQPDHNRTRDISTVVNLKLNNSRGEKVVNKKRGVER